MDTLVTRNPGRRPSLWVGSRLVRAALVGLLAALILASGTVPAAAGTAVASRAAEEAVGAWIAPFSEGGMFDDRAPSNPEEAARVPAAASLSVSPDGTVIYWNGIEGSENYETSIGWGPVGDRESRTRILDLRSFLKGTSTKPFFFTPAQERGIGGDLFCSDLRRLPDGRLLVVGGTEWINEDESYNIPGGGGRIELWGRKEARFFDPETERWEFARPMNHKRWYPTLVSLPDGKLLVAGGTERLAYNDSGRYVNQTETFNPKTSTWTENGPAGEATLPFYARLHLLPTGKVFYDGTGQMWGPWGSTVDMAEWNVQKIYDPKMRSWADAGVAPLGGRSGSFSAMLPLEPPYDSARILIGGGTFGPATPGSYLGNNVTELVEVSDDGVKRTLGPQLNNPRWYSSGVVLPSGEVIAINGGDRDDTIMPGVTRAVRRAEMFDGEKWVPLSSGSRDRVYHNTAVLLGDGSILVGGHAPLPEGFFFFGNRNTAPGPFSSNLRDPSFEIFKPPYLFRGQRPEITRVQSGIGLGDSFRIHTPNASKITSVVLSRLPSVTHLADADQRTIELTFSKNGSRGLVASMPDDAAVALPGHYYLFLMTDNGQGPTPSRAAIVQVGEKNMKPAPMPYGE